MTSKSPLTCSNLAIQRCPDRLGCAHAPKERAHLSGGRFPWQRTAGRLSQSPAGGGLLSDQSGLCRLAPSSVTPSATAQEGIEALSVKVGTVLLVLGGMHFFNLFIFSRMAPRPRCATASRRFTPTPLRLYRRSRPADTDILV